MGALCCCLHSEDFEEYSYPSNTICGHCICLRYFFHQLLRGYGATFQRLNDGLSGPSQIQTATSSTVGNAHDNSSWEINHIVPRPQSYEADARCSHPLGLTSGRGKSVNRIQEDLHTLRAYGSSSGTETLGSIKIRNMLESNEGCKLIHTESEKIFSAKAIDMGFIVTSSEDEDVCPTCLEGDSMDYFSFCKEYTPENPKIVANCSHHFHLSCIYEWMERSDSCPVCGKEMGFCESP